MTAPDCLFPDDCPVPNPHADVLRRIRTTVVPSGTRLFRGHPARYDADAMVPATGGGLSSDRMTRFAPVAGAAHAYVARRQTAALLESAFHDATPPHPRVRRSQVERQALTAVVTTVDLRLIDLRDGQLDRLGLGRPQLVTSLPAHYPCTREWAEALLRRHVGGHETHGLLWNSRQAELHADAGHNPLTADLLAGEATEVAIVWPPPWAPLPLRAVEGAPGRLDSGEGRRLAQAVANLIGAPIDLDT